MVHETDSRPVRSTNMLVLIRTRSSATAWPARIVEACAARRWRRLRPLRDMKRMSLRTIYHRKGRRCITLQNPQPLKVCTVADLRLDPGDNGLKGDVAGLTLSVLEIDYIVTGVCCSVSTDISDVWTPG